MMDEKTGGRRAQHEADRCGDEMNGRRGDAAVTLHRVHRHLRDVACQVADGSAELDQITGVHRRTEEGEAATADDDPLGLRLGGHQENNGLISE